MKKNTIFASFSTLLFTISLMTAAQTLNAQSVKAEFAFCAAGDTVCETNNRVRQDKNSLYTDRVDGVSAVFYSTGSRDLVINLINSKRTVRLDFRSPAYGPQPSWWATAPQQNAKPLINVLEAFRAKELCVPDVNGNCVYDFVTQMNCGSWKASGDNRSEYKLQWNPTSIQPYINTPESTSQVNVRYIKNGADEVFVITPLPNSSSNRIIAGLQKTLSQTNSAAGQYEMPFQLTVRFK